MLWNDPSKFLKQSENLIKQHVSELFSLLQTRLIVLVLRSKLYVGNLSWSTTDDRLRSAFEEFGTITDAIVMKDRETGRNRGFGFVTFANQTDANNAINQMDGVELVSKKPVTPFFFPRSLERFCITSIIRESLNGLVTLVDCRETRSSACNPSIFLLDQSSKVAEGHLSNIRLKESTRVSHFLTLSFLTCLNCI
jgi:RNA recognition motif-containing protein